MGGRSTESVVNEAGAHGQAVFARDVVRYCDISTVEPSAGVEIRYPETFRLLLISVDDASRVACKDIDTYGYVGCFRVPSFLKRGLQIGREGVLY